MEGLAVWCLGGRVRGKEAGAFGGPPFLPVTAFCVFFESKYSGRYSKEFRPYLFLAMS